MTKETKKTESKTKAARVLYSKDAQIKLLVEDNPKRPKSAAYDKFEFYRKGLKYGDFVALCKAHPKLKNRTSLRFDVEHGLIEVLPAGTKAA